MERDIRKLILFNYEQSRLKPEVMVSHGLVIVFTENGNIQYCKSVDRPSMRNFTLLAESP